MAIKRRFVYVTRDPASGAETLRLATMALIQPRMSPRARALGPLLVASGANGAPSEVFLTLQPSPQNTRLLAYVEQLGSDFIDHNLHVVNLDNGVVETLLNEHSLSVLNRTKYGSKLFEDYLANLAADGADAATLAALDWFPVVEGQANIPAPSFGWVDDTTLIVRFRLVIMVSPGGIELGEEDFVLACSSADNFGTFTKWNGPVPPPPPQGPLSIAAAPPDEPGKLLYKGLPLHFHTVLFFLTRAIKGTKIAGLVT